MGRIIQLEESSFLLPIEAKQLTITNFRYMIDEADSQISQLAVDICVGINLFRIYDVTIDQIVALANSGDAESYKFSYLKSCLLCANCDGTGIIDWVHKATKTNATKKSPRGHMLHTFKDSYKRGTTYHKLRRWNDKIIFTSSSVKRLGDEYCFECYGCGIKLPDIEEAKMVTEIKMC